MKIAAVIVAAGRSSRFEGGNKHLAQLNGEPVIRHVARAVVASPVTDAVLVIADDGDAIADAAAESQLRKVVNTDAASGLSSSIKTGLATLDPLIDGALIVLGDMPSVTAALLDELCKTFAAHGGNAIVFPVTRDGRQANPVLWPRALFAELMKLSGDTGGKALLVASTARHAPIPIEDDNASLDIDTVADLEQAAKAVR